MKKIKVKNHRIVFTIFTIVLILLAILYYDLVFKYTYAKNQYSSQVVQMAEVNENPIFKIYKISLYSSADVIDSSENQTLQDLSILQYSDIAIYLDNTSYLDNTESDSTITNENTIKELYIDSISITTNSDLGHQYVNYKNALDFAKYTEIDELTSDKIEYNIVTTNEENTSTNYSNPTFYTDCSNPITLEYINEKIVTNYSASDSTTISFNGKVLEEANIDLDDLSYKLSFTIHITNNLNQQFICPVTLDVELDGSDGGIYKEYKSETTTVSGYEYSFIQLVEK